MNTKLNKRKSNFCFALAILMAGLAGCKTSQDVVAPVSNISGFSPANPIAGDSVTIKGTNFDPDKTKNIVKFGDKIATVISASATELRVAIPKDAPRGKVTFSLNGASLTNGSKDLVVNSIYVAGSVWDNDRNEQAAKYWKDNIEIPGLEDGSSFGFYSTVTSIIKSGNDIYATGLVNTIEGVLWKNGIRQTLPNWYVTNSVAVNGADVIVAGNRMRQIFPDPQYIFRAAYTINGSEHLLSNDQNISEAYSIAVNNNNDVYVVGHEDEGLEGNQEGNPVNLFGPSKARCWKNNNQIVPLEDDGKSSAAYDIAISNNSVYVVGYVKHENPYFKVATLWKDGVAINLSNNGEANVITISNNTIYVGGNENINGKEIPTYWIISGTNVQKIPLSPASTSTYITDIAVNDTDVYVSGNQFKVGKSQIWKNGFLTSITGGESAFINSIFIAP